MKTRIYDVIYCQDAPCYGTYTFEARHDGEAIARALTLDWDDIGTDPELGNARNRRIVQIDDGDRIIATDIPFEFDDGALADCRIRAAARDLYDALMLARFELERIHGKGHDNELQRKINAALDKADGRDA
jgi:hypothetical protein